MECHSSIAGKSVIEAVAKKQQCVRKRSNAVNDFNIRMTYPEDEEDLITTPRESDTPRTVDRRRRYYEMYCKQIPKEDKEKDFDGSRKHPTKFGKEVMLSTTSISG